MVAKKDLKKGGEGFGLVGFIFGILSIVFIASNGIILAILGFIFSSMQQKRKPTKFARLGKILSIIGFILAILLIIFLFIFAETLTQQLGNFPVN